MSKLKVEAFIHSIGKKTEDYPKLSKTPLTIISNGISIDDERTELCINPVKNADENARLISTLKELENKEVSKIYIKYTDTDLTLSYEGSGDTVFSRF